MMTPHRRTLMHQVMDHQPAILPTLHFLDRFVRCDEMLQWLVDNKITGKEFLNFVHFKFPESQLSMAKFILKRIKKSRDDGKVFQGRDMQ